MLVGGKSLNYPVRGINDRDTSLYNFYFFVLPNILDILSPFFAMAMDSSRIDEGLVVYACSKNNSQSWVIKIPVR